MNQFILGQYPSSSVLVVYSEREEIELSPDYQRISGVWTRDKRQLLIDSLLNGYDVPKFYFHAFTPSRTKGNRTYRYAIIDGKQRLQAIWEFINDDLPLAEDFVYLHDEGVELGGLKYSELAVRYPVIKARFDASPLSIVTINTEDMELIEDLFSRLNEAVALNAPEKRNAFGGPMPEIIRAVANHEFFLKRIPFRDKRYRHRDLAAKFLYLQFANRIVNTKKTDLDGFVRDFKRRRSEGDDRGSRDAARRLRRTTESTLALMAEMFGDGDSLLRQVGMVTLYFHLFRATAQACGVEIERQMLEQFEVKRAENRQRAEVASDADSSVNTELLEFDNHSQTPNDAYALRTRLEILLRYLGEEFGVKLDSEVVEREVAPERSA